MSMIKQNKTALPMDLILLNLCCQYTSNSFATLVTNKGTSHSSSTTDDSPTFSALHPRHLYLTTIRDIEESECRAYTAYTYKVNRLFRFYNISEWSNINCFEINNL